MAATHAHASPPRLRLAAAPYADVRFIALAAALIALAVLGLALALSLPTEPAHAPASFLGTN